MNKKQNRLIILRGLPWSGKSYRAKELAGKDGLIFSTDEYWYKIEDGKNPNIYSFNPNKLKQAHEWNQHRAKEAIQRGKPLIIIDNTNVRKSEPKPYIEMGLVCDYEIMIEEPTSAHWLELRPLLSDKNKNSANLKKWAAFLAKGSKETHNVPQEAIERMMFRWEYFSINDFV